MWKLCRTVVSVGQQIYGNLGLRNSTMAAVIEDLIFPVSALFQFLKRKKKSCKKLGCVELLKAMRIFFYLEIYLLVVKRTCVTFGTLSVSCWKHWFSAVMVPENKRGIFCFCKMLRSQIKPCIIDFGCINFFKQFLYP